MYFFKLGKFFPKVSMNTFSVPLRWSPIPICLRFVLFMVSQISSIFCVKILLNLTFSLIKESVFSIVSLTLEIIFSISCIMLVMLTSVNPDHLPRYSNSKIFYFVFFYIASVSFQVLNWLNCLFYFLIGIFWISLRDLLISSNFVSVLPLISLREIFTSSLRVSLSFIKLYLRLVSSVLGCSGLGHVEILVSSVSILLFMFLNVFLPCHLPFSSSSGWLGTVLQFVPPSPIS